MVARRILLWDMPYEVMVIVEHPSGVLYQNQVGGVCCWQGELEGVLAPVDLSPESVETIMGFPYPSGREGITEENADAIDAVLSAHPGSRHFRVDRLRLEESWEAWVYVLIDSPASTVGSLTEEYFGSVYGFGPAKGVLTWINSD